MKLPDSDRGNYSLTPSATLVTVPPVSCTRSSNLRRNTAFGVRPRPDLVENTQVFIDDDEHRFGVPDRRYASNGEASAVANKVSVGALNRFTEMGCDDRLMHAVGSAGDDYHGSIADGRAQHQRLRDLPYCAADRCRSVGSRAVDASNSITSKRGPSTPDSQRSAMRGWFHLTVLCGTLLPCFTRRQIVVAFLGHLITAKRCCLLLGTLYVAIGGPRHRAGWFKRFNESYISARSSRRGAGPGCDGAVHQRGWEYGHPAQCARKPQHRCLSEYPARSREILKLPTYRPWRN